MGRSQVRDFYWFRAILRNGAVREDLDLATCSGVPWETILPPFWPASGPMSEDPIGFGGDGHVVLDDDDGVAFVGEAVEDVDEAFYVFEVEADGGFLDEVEIASFELGVIEGGFGAAAFDDFRDEFDALGFASRKGRGGLAEL